MIYRLREIRKQRGMTQEALSHAAKVNRVNIAKYENGVSSPTLKTVEKLSLALGCTIDDLVQKCADQDGCDQATQAQFD